MITAHIRRTITCLLSQSCSIQRKSRDSFSFSVLYFSSATETKPLNTPTIFEFLLHKHNFSPEVASKIDSVSSKLTINHEKFDATLSYFKEIGFTNAQIQKTIRFRPTLLTTSVDKVIKPKIKLFQDMGFSSKDIASIVSRDPGILHANSEKRLTPSLLYLKDFLGSKEEVVKVLKQSGWLLMTDLRNNMGPNVEFLKSCGITSKQINMLMISLPRFFLYKLEDVKKCVQKVDQMGVDRNSKVFVYAVVFVGAIGNTWDLKLQAFRDILKFSEEDILRVFRSCPLAYTVSECKMKKVKGVLLATGKYELSSIVECPRSLLFSIEKRYTPRLEVLALLDRRHRLEQWPRLSVLCNVTDDIFYNRYVNPYLDDPVISAWHKDNPIIKDGTLKSAD